MPFSAPVGRRSFLAALTGGALLALAPRARADGAFVPFAPRVRTSTRDARGVTLWLELDKAPFPAPNAGYKDRTVIVFVPHHFRCGHGDAVSMLVHFHGHSTTADKALVSHELREQLFDSKQNAILVVPQGPVNASDSSCGKLESPLGFARMLDETLEVLATPDAREALARTAIPRGAHPGTVCISAHSGGYHAAACALKHGGIEVNEAFLFDALYNEADVFRDWVVAGKGRPAHARHKLVSYFTDGGTTAALTRQLFGELEKAGVKCALEAKEGTLTREEITRAEAVAIKTALWHNNVTHELNGLRDCLYASGMTRKLRSAWFDHKSDSRVLERRR
jgi:hypothetical protein